MSFVRSWGTTPEEESLSYPCDEFEAANAHAWFRGVSVEAPASAVFPWLCQLRLAPYSYDWIDNFGRRSPRELTPSLQELEIGQRFMGGFALLSFEPNRHITVGTTTSRIPTLFVSYAIRPADAGQSRLLVKLAVPHVRWIARAIDTLGAAGDLIMMRRQLLNLKALAEATPRGE